MYRNTLYPSAENSTLDEVIIFPFYVPLLWSPINFKFYAKLSVPFCAPAWGLVHNKTIYKLCNAIPFQFYLLCGWQKSMHGT
jgi:hypothetical protein